MDKIASYNLPELANSQIIELPEDIKRIKAIHVQAIKSYHTVIAAPIFNVTIRENVFKIYENYTDLNRQRGRYRLRQVATPINLDTEPDDVLRISFETVVPTELLKDNFFKLLLIYE